MTEITNITEATEDAKVKAATRNGKRGQGRTGKAAAKAQADAKAGGAVDAKGDQVLPGKDTGIKAEAPKAAAPDLKPTRGTWKGHGQPTLFVFNGTARKAPGEPQAVKAHLNEAKTGIVLMTVPGRGQKATQVAEFGVATTFWAIVPPQVDTAKAANGKAAKTEAAGPKGVAKVTAPKATGKDAVRLIVIGGPGQGRKGTFAKAVKATGKPLNQIAREGVKVGTETVTLNPAQLRRLVADEVKAVDKVRADLIARALGVKTADLFKAEGK
jgi:hypothetical protein